MTKSKEQKFLDHLKRIKKFRLLDDDFMTACLQDNIEGMELIIRIIMNNNDLHVTDVKTQYTMKNLHGRSVRLDVYATDNNGKKYNIEIQRADKGAGAKRARFNSALIDSREIPAGFDTEDLPETHVIFITEHDVFGHGLPVYHIDRVVRETGELFPDEAHIIYVNATIKDDTPLGRLMSDFACDNADDMYYDTLAKRVRYFKEDERGVHAMCKAIEDLVKEERREEKIQIARNLITLGRCEMDEIAVITGLDEKDILELFDSMEV